VAGIAFLFLTGLYFLPTIVAASRGKRSTIAVGALNFFAGWTFIGWVVALIWALSGERDYQHVVYVSQNVNMPPYPYGAQQQWQQRSYIPPQQAQYIDRSGPPMNVTQPRRAPSSSEIRESYHPWNG
jgi:hypothetical protein